MTHYYLETPAGQKELSKPSDPAAAAAALAGTEGGDGAMVPAESGTGAGGEGGEGGEGDAFRGSLRLTTREKTAARREPQHVVEEFVQQLQLIFERAPKADLISSLETERRSAVDEAVEQAAAGRPLAITKGESLSIAQRAVRLLTTCAALGGDHGYGEILAQKSITCLMELLMGAEANEELIITEALAVLVPPILSPNCKDWIQWSHLGLMNELVKTKPLVGLQLSPLAPMLQRIAVAEMGSAPLPLFLLLGNLARYEDTFPRTKSARPDALHAISPAAALHEAGITGAVVSWLDSPTGGAGRTMDSWTLSRQLCVWKIAEGVSRHVRAAATQLVKEGAASKVKDELLELLKGGQVHLTWRAEKTALVSQLVLTAEALSRFSNDARSTLFALPSRMGAVLGDEAWAAKFDDDAPLLMTVLPMLTRLPERADPTLLAALLHLYASLIQSATGAMLVALSEMVTPPSAILKLALSRSEGGCLEDILKACNLPVHPRDLAASPRPAL